MNQVLGAPILTIDISNLSRKQLQQLESNLEEEELQQALRAR
jgi:hypothetical protein